MRRGVCIFACVSLASASARAQDLRDPFFRPRKPISTSGTDVAPSPRPIPRVDPIVAQRLRSLEEKVQRLERDRAAQQSDADSLAAWSRRLRISAFVQPQFVAAFFNREASPNPSDRGPNDTLALPDGDTTNAVFFRMRRARLRLDADLATWAGIEKPMVRLVFELEPIPRTRGIPESGTLLRQTEAQLFLPWSCAEITKGCALSTLAAMGLMRVPFGYEVLEPETARPFLERSFGAQSMFPGEFDLGARADTRALGERLTFTAALLNGRTIGEQGGSVVPDLNRGKDGAFRFHYRADAFGIGASGYYGVGQRVDATSLAIKTFPRWAAGVDVELHHAFDRGLGETRAVLEGVLGANMDRGVIYPFALPDIPADIKADVDARQEAYFQARVEQDTTRWLTWALRVDAYTPSTRLPDNARITGAFSGTVHMTKHLRFLVEYAHARDTIRPEGAPKPFRHVTQWSATLEARF